MALTPNQLRVLATVANNRGPAHRVYALGRHTCEALRKRGLVSAGDDNAPINSRLDGNPYIEITELGRRALTPDEGR